MHVRAPRGRQRLCVILINMFKQKNKKVAMILDSAFYITFIFDILISTIYYQSIIDALLK